MKIIRYQDKQSEIHYGASTDGGKNYFKVSGSILETDDIKVTKEPADISKLLAPIDPPTFFCIGLNYVKHAEESGAKIPEYPVIVSKARNSVCAHGDEVPIPHFLKSDQVDYECEIAFVIGKKCKNATLENALDYVLGYTCCNDVTARDWQFQYGGGQWTRCKIFDNFAPLGPCITLKDEISDPQNLELKTILNGEVVQQSNTSDMIFSIATLVKFLSGSTTLLPGTVVSTGTPAGVGMSKTPKLFLKAGDECTIEIEKIGKLTNKIVDEKI